MNPRVPLFNHQSYQGTHATLSCPRFIYRRADQAARIKCGLEIYGRLPIGLYKLVLNKVLPAAHTAG